jgi:hypothetical protein
MRRVLIVSPHFPPVNAPDMQRVRLALPFLAQHGWEAVVLAVDPASIEGAVLDPLLEQTYPAQTRVVRVHGVNPRLTRWAGIGNLWWRCGRALREAGDALLRAERFDLVFFSTTQFDAFRLGPRWRRRFGVPYVLDYQDPWINPYYHRTGTRPPGGWLKFAVSQFIAGCIEPRALREAAAVIAVSPSYGPALKEQYPWFDASRVQVLPFGASAADFAVAARHRPVKPLVDFDDGRFHHVYAGRCGPDMSLAMTVLFRAFRLFLDRSPAEAAKIRFHFIGTDYAPPPLGRYWALPIAEAEGVRPYVEEHCYRVPYFDALHYLIRANALVAVGSNDPTYAASKIFPYILAHRPMVLIYHHNSQVLDFARRAAAGIRFSFGGPDDVTQLAHSVLQQWFGGDGRFRYVPYDETAVRGASADALTQRLTAVFTEAATNSRD